MLAVKAHHTEGAVRALAPHLADDGAVVSAQNGLNEIVIAKVVGEARTIGCFVNFGADYLEPGRIMRGNRGAVVVGEIDGRVTPRIEAVHGLFRIFEPDAVLTNDIWGYLWGKLAYGALLFATALTNESIADALASRAPPPGLPPRRRGGDARRRRRAASLPRGFNGFDPGAFTPGAPDGGDARVHRRHGRLQPPVGEVAFRHLARPRRAQAQDRGRRAGRHRGRSRRRGRRSRRRHSAVSSP